jgi:hypothetical protein
MRPDIEPILQSRRKIMRPMRDTTGRKAKRRRLCLDGISR